MALHTGAKSLIYPEISQFDCFLPYPDEVGSQHETDTSFENLDRNITMAWQFMKRFCSLINAAVEAQGRIPWKLFLNSMRSVMYRLLNIRFDTGSMNEAIRLGLLLYSSNVFLQWKLVRLPFTHLTYSFRRCINLIETLDSPTPELYSWLLMVDAISVFKLLDDDPWLWPRLRASMESSSISSWNEMQTVLESLMWIRLLLDGPRKGVLDSIFRIK
jgi:hypothetical protein